MSMREVGIGIAGLGTVGGGVLAILRAHAGKHVVTANKALLAARGNVLTEGVMDLTPEDIAWGRELGYTLKLLAVARRCSATDGAGGDQIEARVHPTSIPRDSLLAGVRGAMNASGRSTGIRPRWRLPD